MARRHYAGAAVPTRLGTGIGTGDTSFTLNSNAGWPTGGANGPFSVILDPDTPSEEHVTVANQAGGNCTGVTRGVGDTSAKTHSVGSDGSVIHGTYKADYDEANRHINDTTIDEHTQYMKTDGTRHDLTARHAYGGALGTRPTPVAIGTALSAGSGAQAAAGDHVHIVGAGALNNANMFVANTIPAGILQTGAISASAMFAAGVVNDAALGADSVGSSELKDASIDALALFGGTPLLNPIIVSATDPGAVGANRVWLNTTAAKRALLCRNAGNSAWEVINTFGPGVDYTPTLFNFSIGTAPNGGFNYARYRRHGRSIIVDGFCRFGTDSPALSGRIGIALPHAAANLSASKANEFFFHAAARAVDIAPSGFAYGGVGIIGVGTVTNQPDRVDFFATAGGVAWNATTPFSWNGGDNDRFSWFAEYEAANAEDTNYV